MPVCFVRCERARGGKGPGKIIWCVGFELEILDGNEDRDEDGDAEGEEDEDEDEEEQAQRSRAPPNNSGDID